MVPPNSFFNMDLIEPSIFQENKPFFGLLSHALFSFKGKL